MNKQQVFYIMVGIAVVLFLVLILVLARSNTSKREEVETTSSTTTVTEFDNSDTTEKTYLTGTEEEYTTSPYDGAHEEGDGVIQFYLDGEGSLDTLIEDATIDGEEGQYYFEEGIYNPSYTGLAQYRKDDEWYYVKDGKQNLNYSGLAERNGHQWLVIDGKVQTDFDGTAKVGGKEYQFNNGAVVE